MPRIRKKTSKRGTTHQRVKIKHKAVETRKKRKKEAKKNPQWKSKHKKDPGIPNNFPYKDQILAEVAEERRLAEEVKQRQKELKKAAKAGTVEAQAGSGDEGSEAGYDGISAVHQATLASGSGNSKVAEDEVGMEEAPVLINPDWPNLKAVVDAADVVVEVLDARDPLSYRLKHLEEAAKEKEGRKLLLALTKIDACPRESVSSWATALRGEHPTILFRSASAFLPTDLVSVPAKGKDKMRADDALGLTSVLAVLEKWAGEKTEGPLVVAVIGLTNVGKSSFVNSLAKKAAVPIYKLASTRDGHSTTTHAQEVTLEISGKRIRLVDTPGTAWASSPDLSENDKAALRAKDILTRNKGRIDRLKDPEPVTNEIIQRTNKEDLMLFYNLPAFADKDVHAFLSGLARANNLIKKGGVLDVAGASRIVVRDWSTGKLPRYTTPGTSTAKPADASLVEVYAKDEAILQMLTPRKELRKSSGAVKLDAGAADARKVDLEVPWLGDDGSDEEEEDEDGEDAGVSEQTESRGEEDEEDEDEDEEDEEGDEEGEEDEPEDEEDDDEEQEEEPVQTHSKRKRSSGTSLKLPPAKKVAFAPEPKNTKQARSAAGAKGALVAASRKAMSTELRRTPRNATSKPKGVKPATKLLQPAKTAPTKKAANSASSSKTAAQTKPGEEAYDFKKFF